MALLKRPIKEAGYDFNTPESIEQRIRADLSRIGTVTDVKGDILIVDGDWFLNDVHAVVDGKTVNCHRSGDGITYQHHYRDIRLSYFRSPYDNPEMQETTSQFLHRIHRESRSSKEFVLSVEIVMFVLTVGILFSMMLSIFSGGAAMLLSLVIMALLGAAVTWWMNREFFAARKADRERNARPFREVAEENKDAATRHAILTCKSHGWTYVGDMEIMHNDSPESTKIYFKMKNTAGKMFHCNTNGVTVGTEAMYTR